MMSRIDGAGAGQPYPRSEGPSANDRAEAASFDAAKPSDGAGEEQAAARLQGAEHLERSAEPSPADALRDLVQQSIARGESRDTTLQQFVREELESSLGPDLPSAVVEQTTEAFRTAPELRQLFEQIYSRAQEGR